MKIRTQNLLTIVPIFIVLAGITGILSYTTQKQDLLWGMQESVSSIATATAEFIDGDVYPEWETRGILTRPGLDFSIALQRIMKWRQTYQIYGLTPDGKKLTFATADTAPKLPDSQTIGDINNAFAADTVHEIFITGIVSSDSNRYVMAAYAPIKNNLNEIAGLLVAEIDAAPFLKQLETITRETLIIVAGIILIGFFTAGLLSSYLTRRITQLTHASRVVTAGQYDYEVDIQSPQELKDLSNTFNTMSSVMKDVLHKTKRSMLEEEHFKKESDLALTYAESHRRLINKQFHSWSATGCLVSPDTVHELIDFIETGDALYLLLGSIKQKNPLHDVLQKSSLIMYLKHAILKNGLAGAIRQAQPLFDIQNLYAVKISSGSDVVTKYSIRQDQINEDNTEVPFDTPYIIQTVDNQALNTITNYLSHLSDIPQNDIALDIQRILPKRSDGGILFIRHHKQL